MNIRNGGKYEVVHQHAIGSELIGRGKLKVQGGDQREKNYISRSLLFGREIIFTKRHVQ